MTLVARRKFEGINLVAGLVAFLNLSRDPKRSISKIYENFQARYIVLSFLHGSERTNNFSNLIVIFNEYKLFYHLTLALCLALIVSFNLKVSQIGMLLK